MGKKSSIEKQTITLLVDKEAYREFQKYCEKNGYTFSGRISAFMREVVKNER